MKFKTKKESSIIRQQNLHKTQHGITVDVVVETTSDDEKNLYGVAYDSTGEIRIDVKNCFHEIKGVSDVLTSAGYWISDESIDIKISDLLWFYDEYVDAHRIQFFKKSDFDSAIAMGMELKYPNKNPFTNWFQTPISEIRKDQILFQVDDIYVIQLEDPILWVKPKDSEIKDIERLNLISCVSHSGELRPFYGIESKGVKEPQTVDEAKYVIRKISSGRMLS